MSEWIHVCQSVKHQDDAIPAAGCYVSPHGHRYWYCRECSIKLGTANKDHRYKWEPLREPSPAPPTSERVQP